MTRPASVCKDYLIFNHPQFISYKQKIEIILESWCNRFLPILRELQSTHKAKDLIAQLSESILSDFSQTSLIDAYDVYYPKHASPKLCTFSARL